MPTTKLTTFPELLRAAIDSHAADTYHILPGIVVAYNASQNTADVQIAIDDPRFDPDTDERQDEPWPVYPSVRVVWPRFGGTTLVGTLGQGDKVQCFFQDLDDSKFRSTGQQGSPQNSRRFGSDAVFAVPWDVTDGGVAGTQFDTLALASKVEKFCQDIITWVKTGTAGGNPFTFPGPDPSDTTGSTIGVAH